MIIKTADNSMLNLANYDALEMVSKPAYDRTEYIIEAVIFDAGGDMAVEKPVCQFRSVDEADAYLKNIEKDTAYVRMPTSQTSLIRKDLTLLNLARFHALDFVVKDVPPGRMAGKGMEEHLSPSTKKQATVRAIQYDAFGAELKTVRYSAKFESKEAAVAWFNQRFFSKCRSAERAPQW